MHIFSDTEKGALCWKV